MKILSVILVIVVAVFITLYEWPRIDQHLKKEKRAFVMLTIVGILLSALLIYFPEMPGPTELVQWVFKPLSGLLGG
ncbi:hypothetical protein [Virgibacillus doumboii]|uniref:hypothetical protein n=1 Tax=Virgibacillus doumboii TaxID=2697503 RepID=UPI0013DEF075|nr:hypothetical protein [Virgibacillus doumboii]